MKLIKNCALCNGEIVSTAKKCMHCGEWVNQEKEFLQEEIFKPVTNQLDGDERVQCGGCGKKMVPRIITAPSFIRGMGASVPKKSICPYCATTFKKFSLPSDERIKIILYAIFLVIFFYIFFYQPG